MPLLSPVYASRKEELRHQPLTWLVTGAAGFIGSHLVDALLRLDQRVIGLDNLSSGKHSNLDAVRNSMKPLLWSRFQFFEGDIRDSQLCATACQGVDIALHQAALCSVPASLENPLATHHVNVTGFVELLDAARRAGVQRVVYASSCAVYGDNPDLPNVEDRIGRPLSPYALSKYLDELYATHFSQQFGLATIGLRYFNVFGPRQDPAGAYAAVIPRWIRALLQGERAIIYGDGETTRDFCFVENVVQANVLAGSTRDAGALNQVFNVSLQRGTSLNSLYRAIRDQLAASRPGLARVEPDYQPFRAGDIRHSAGSNARGVKLLGFKPEIDLETGLAQTITAYSRQFSAAA